MVPVGITVEGANILTRTLITFAQGALRSHPYLFTEIEALQNNDQSAATALFERAFDDHVGLHRLQCLRRAVPQFDLRPVRFGAAQCRRHAPLVARSWRAPRAPSLWSPI